MPDSDNHQDHQNGGDDGYLRACEGILRTDFGRRRFDVTAKAVERLKIEQQNVENAGLIQSDRNWRKAFSILWRGLFSPAAAVALVPIFIGLWFLWGNVAPGKLDRQPPQKGQAVKKEDLQKILDEAFYSLKRTNYLAAEKSFRQVLDFLPTDAQAHFGLGEIRRVERKFDEAAQFYRTAIKLQPPYAAAYTGLGLVSWEEGQFADAEAMYRTAIRLDPNDSAAYHNLGEIYCDIYGDLEEAERLYRKAISFSPNDAESYHGLGKVFSARSNLRDAETMFRAALDRNPDSSSYNNSLGDIYREKGDLTEARRLFERARELDPENPSPYRGLATLDAMAGRLDKAEQAYRETLARQKDWDPSRLPTLMNLGVLCEKQNRLKEAEDYFRQALQFRPNEPRVWRDLAYFLAEHQLKLDEALDLARRAVKVDPRNSGFLHALGLVLLERGELEEAESRLKTALARAPDDKSKSEIQQHLTKLREKRSQ
jgi:Flp pilus assembly protein TadD